MKTENLQILKINILSKEQYNRELAAGRTDTTALYFTPDEEIDMSQYVTTEQLENLVGEESVSTQISNAITTALTWVNF